MVRIFRTTTKYWLTEGLALPLMLAAVAFGVWAVHAGHTKAIHILILAPFALHIGLFNFFIPALTGFVQIDSQGISGHVHKLDFTVPWPALVAAEVRTQGAQPCLELVTDERSYLVPVRQFDHQEIWRLVQQYAPPRALEKDAYRRAAWHEKQSENAAELLRATRRPLRVLTKQYLLTGIGFALFCLILAFFSWRSGQTAPAIAFAVISLIGFYLLAETGIIEMTDEGVRYRLIWRSDAIRWDEIRAVETDGQKQTYVLQGDNKQLRLPGPAGWGGRDRNEFIAYFNAQLDQRNLRIEESNQVVWTNSKNTRQK